MYKLIIADDEERIRESLSRFIDWNGLGFDVAATFEDGREVVEYLGQHGADAVLTDIAMAEVSGLAVADFVCRGKLRTKVVIISGYQEFEYARKAIEYNVKHYLLKPTDEEEIERVFRQIRQTLDEEGSREDLRSRIDERLDKSPLSVSEKPYMNLFKGTVNREDLIKRIGTDGFDQFVLQQNEDASLMIDLARDYIEENYGRDISLEDVANHVFLSPGYFSRFFKQQTGENFSDFLIRVRINHAIRLLQDRKYKIYEISSMVGYSSSQYFNRQFRQVTGYSPKEYCRIVLKDGGADDE